ncbi:MAG: hypothetical protein ACI3ZT_00875 [Candidatus Cryptobacteroides sp.]
MKLAEKILHRMRPDTASFTADEIQFVSEVIAAYNEEKALLGRKSALPTRFVEIGGNVVVRSRVFRCEEAEKISLPSEACSGCSLSKLYLGCGDLQCSAFDRRDRKFVWFKEVKK